MGLGDGMSKLMCSCGVAKVIGSDARMRANDWLTKYAKILRQGSRSGDLFAFLMGIPMFCLLHIQISISKSNIDFLGHSSG